jgi:hypothetical protein
MLHSLLGCVFSWCPVKKRILASVRNYTLAVSCVHSAEAFQMRSGLGVACWNSNSSLNHVKLEFYTSNIFKITVGLDEVVWKFNQLTLFVTHEQEGVEGAVIRKETWSTGHFGIRASGIYHILCCNVWIYYSTRTQFKRFRIQSISLFLWSD